MIDQPYIEAFLEWAEGETHSVVERWLREQGLEFIPMRAGLLLTGPPEAFERAFRVDLAEVEPPVRLEIPDDVREAVASVTIPVPREIFEGGGGSVDA
jgi:hypothetical protein